MAGSNFTPLSPRTLDLRDKRFGRLLCLSQVILEGKERQSAWLCRCDCGVEKVVPAKNLLGGDCRSCGCFHRDSAAERSSRLKKTHGMSGTVEFTILSSIKQRCCNPKDAAYKNYGGRGITVCDRWLDKKKGLLNFVEDMGKRPSPLHSIDRINNDGPYSPENCRWATRQQQARNRKSSRFLTCNGVTKLMCEWVDETGLSHALIRHRLRNGWTVEEALLTPKNKNKIPHRYRHPHAS